MPKKEKAISERNMDSIPFRSDYLNALSHESLS